jgi:hypothetical protein
MAGSCVAMQLQGVRKGFFVCSHKVGEVLFPESAKTITRRFHVANLYEDLSIFCVHSSTKTVLHARNGLAGSDF